MTLGVGDPPDEIFVATIDQVENFIFGALKVVSGLKTIERFATTKNSLTKAEDRKSVV